MGEICPQRSAQQGHCFCVMGKLEDGTQTCCLCGTLLIIGADIDDDGSEES